MRSAMENFLDEIAAVCKKHGFSIAHEDYHGGFIIEPYQEYNLKWLRDAKWSPIKARGALPTCLYCAREYPKTKERPFPWLCPDCENDKLKRKI